MWHHRPSRHGSRWRLVVVLLLVMPLVSGCWDRIEMEKRATILGLAIDLPNPADEAIVSKGNSTDSKTVLHTSELYSKLEQERKIEVTAQIAVPGRIPLGPGTGEGTQPRTAVWVIHAFGISLGDALKELQQHLAERVFLGHLRIITISDAVAKQKGIVKYLDYLRRNPDIRRTAWLTVCKGRADTLMKTAPPLERVPTLYLLSTMQSAVHLGKLPPDFLGIVESKQSMWGRDPVIPYLVPTSKNQVDILGIAAFSRGKMVYSLSPAEETTFAQLAGAANASTSIIVPYQDNDFIVWTSFARDLRTKVQIINGFPQVVFYLHVDGNVTEKSRENIDLFDGKLIHQIETTMKTYNEQKMRDLLQNTQDEQSDIVGVGEMVRAKQPAYWRTHVHKPEDWTKIYPRVTYDVKAVFQTHRSGMTL